MWPQQIEKRATPSARTEIKVVLEGAASVRPQPTESRQRVNIFPMKSGSSEDTAVFC